MSVQHMRRCALPIPNKFKVLIASLIVSRATVLKSCLAVPRPTKRDRLRTRQQAALLVGGTHDLRARGKGRKLAWQGDGHETQKVAQV